VAGGGHGPNGEDQEARRGVAYTLYASLLLVGEARRRVAYKVFITYSFDVQAIKKGACYVNR
jgi:hypothetical protein